MPSHSFDLLDSGSVFRGDSLLPFFTFTNLPVMRILLLLLLVGSSLLWWQPLAGQGLSRGANTTLSEQIDLLIERLERGDQISGETFNLPAANFELDSYTLTPRAKQGLDRLIDFLQMTDNADLIISGHTDAQGSDEYNDQLAYNRANAVRRYLFAGLGATYPEVPPALISRLRMEAYGERLPVADNESETGRARNRRVDFTVEAKGGEGTYVQDLIILCAGDTLGVRIDFIEEDRIQYRDFSSDEVRTIPTLDVCGTRFAEEKDPPTLRTVKPDTVFQTDTLVQTVRDTVVKTDTVFIDPEVRTTTWNFCSRTFGKGAHIVQLGSDFLHNLEENTPLPDQVNWVPPLSLTYEYGLTCNIGVGGTLAGRYWNNNFAEYWYYSLSARGTFHFPFWGDRIDPYIGLSGTYRAVSARGRNGGAVNRDGTPFSATNDTLSVNALIGVRVHLGATRRWGVFAEGGSDAIGFVRVGAFYLIRPPQRVRVVEKKEEPLPGEAPGEVDDK